MWNALQLADSKEEFKFIIDEEKEQIDLDNITKAQILSYTLAKSAQKAKAQANVNLFEQHLRIEDINNIVEGDVSDSGKFVDDMIISQKDPGTRIDPGNQKESLEALKVIDYVSIDEEEEEKTVEAELI
uniref:Uncharacterized protein n=1 Tax=Tanacetum cinerariifolium TaxID=118510 RepID=A0A6L2KR19_TANCI|nr:hypothetical protein [Tanacetum cinerariifolium]